MSETRRPHPATDRNLLFGVLALQLDFLGRDALIAGMNAWVLAKTRPLGGSCASSGALSAARLDPARRPGRRARRRSRRGRPGSLESVTSRSTVADGLAPSPTRTRSPPCPSWTRGRRPAGRPPPAQRRLPLPAAAAARPRRARRGVRRRGRGAAPRGGPQGDPAAPRRRPGQPGPVPPARPRSPAAWSTPASSPSTAWARTPDGRPYYAMRFVRGDSLKEAIDRFHQADGAGRPPAERALAFRELLRPVRRRVQRDRLRPQPGGDPPRPEAGQRHARPVRRDAGRGLGPGQGRRRPAGRTRPTTRPPTRPSAPAGEHAGRHPGRVGARHARRT